MLLLDVIGYFKIHFLFCFHRFLNRFDSVVCLKFCACWIPGLPFYRIFGKKTDTSCFMIWPFFTVPCIYQYTTYFQVVFTYSLSTFWLILLTFLFFFQFIRLNCSFSILIFCSLFFIADFHPSSQLYPSCPRVNHYEGQYYAAIQNECRSVHFHHCCQDPK